MNAEKKNLFIGLGLMGSFVVVLLLIFMPLFGGRNGLNYMDDLYNSISKGSAYYIPKVKESIASREDSAVTVRLALPEGIDRVQAAMLFAKAGASPSEEGGDLVVSGDLNRILLESLADSDLMYHNDGPALVEKYGYPERKVVYNWYLALKAMGKDLNNQEKFAEAKVVAEVMKRGVECAYNYYTIEPRKISDSLGIVVFSLVFYVVYTLWYGFAYMFLFEGVGMKLGH
jgi:hypothetical protein